MESVGSLQNKINTYLLRDRTDLAVAVIIQHFMHIRDRHTFLQTVGMDTIQKVYMSCLKWLDCPSFANLFTSTKILPDSEPAGEMLRYMRMKYEMISHFQIIDEFETELMKRFLVEWGDRVDLESVNGLRQVFHVKSQELTSAVWSAPLEENKAVNLANVIQIHKKKVG